MFGILNVMYDGFKTQNTPRPLLINMVRAGKLGVKSGEGFYDYSESKSGESGENLRLKNNGGQLMIDRSRQHYQSLILIITELMAK
jgi:3-hydroxyacyl-CoA dehydrogenase